MLDLRSQARRLKRRLRESFTLREAEQRAKAYTAEQQERLEFLHEAIVERLRAARDLRDATRIGAAGAVYRETLLILSRALLFAREPGREADPLDSASAFWELESGEAFSDEKSRLALSEARALAVEEDPLALDRLVPVEALARLDLVHIASIRLLEQIEPRSLATIQRSRAFRRLAVAACALVALGLFVWWAVTPKNVAFGKPAQASSYFPGAGNADTLVNGEIESPFGSATARASRAWFSVDLLADHAIFELVVYNRSDSFGRETTPFVVELSSDGKSFREVARRTDQSVPAQRWSIELHGQVARYVRLTKPDERGLALSEIEVYGSKR